MEYTYVIIDADPTFNLQLRHLLLEYDDFTFAAQADNSTEGLNTILKYSPDLVFINLNENTEDYFQMVMELYQYTNNFSIFIGISHTKEHAYKAIKHNFFDYWLLPYKEFDIRKTLHRIKKMYPKAEKEKKEPQTLCLKSYKDFQYLNTDDILYLQADNNATEFIMKDGSVNHAFKTLKTFENNQLPKNFVRIHQSYIINTNYISRINYGKSICTLKLRALQIPFSKSYKENIDGLKKILSKNTIYTLN